MPVEPERKKALIKKYSKNAHDTGSSQVQVAILTEKINNLSGHFKKHKKDNHSRRGLIRMINNRRNLLDYLKQNYKNEYTAIIKKLGLRK